MPFRPRVITLLAAVVAALALTAAAAPAKTVWLCKPGIAKDPCTPGLATSYFSPAGKLVGVEHPKAAAHPAADCFYVYPTVSGQPTTLANFKIDPVLRSIALYQTARYSQVCRVFAPVYRQVTLTALLAHHTETAAQLATGMGDVRAAFADYLAHYNHGRPFVLIGHSQGSFVLRTLVAKDVDPKPAVRAKLLSAILLGGNVLVQRGQDVGGDFKHLHACHSATQLSCIIAYSTYDQTPPANSLFGRAPKSTEQVLCTNPTSLGGGTGQAELLSPSQPFYQGSALALGIRILGLTYPQASTPWIGERNAYSASCSSAGGAETLQIRAEHGAVTPTPSPDPTWGLHLLDANIALGNLVRIVNSEIGRFGHVHH